MTNKFNEKYKMIMEGRSKMTYNGKSPYSMPATPSYPVKFADGSLPYGKNSDGSPTIDLISGEEQAWRILTTDYQEVTNYLTGLKVPKCTTFYLRWFDGHKDGIHVPIDDYERAYATNDKDTIAKLEAIGLYNGIVY